MVPDRHTLALRHSLWYYLRPQWMRAYASGRLRLVLGELRAWLNGLTRLIPGRIGSRIRRATLGFKRYGKNVRVWEMAWIKLPENISIEDDVWIGTRSVILAGIPLARGTVVAAGGVVTKDTEPYSVVAGVPARIISRRTGAKDMAS